MIPPYLRRGANPDKGVAGRRAEKLASKRMGATTTPGSGALDGAKGDLRVGTLLIENKTSTKDSFSVTKQHLFKIYQEALEVGKSPALSFQFVNPLGKSEKRERWVMLPEALFLEWLG